MSFPKRLIPIINYYANNRLMINNDHNGKHKLFCLILSNKKWCILFERYKLLQR